MMHRLCPIVFAILILISSGIAISVFAQDSHYQSILNMVSSDKPLRQDAAKALVAANDIHLVPAMVDALFYMPRANRGEMFDLLKQITGADAGNNYYDWVEYVGRSPELKSPPGYTRFKTTLLSLIDPTYKKVLYTGVPLRIRPEEIVWGGVRLDGIPPIDQPGFVTGAETKLKDQEHVFGVSLNGESRAYPLRYLSWHEMLNDRIGNEPVTVSY